MQIEAPDRISENRFVLQQDYLGISHAKITKREYVLLDR